MSDLSRTSARSCVAVTINDVPDRRPRRAPETTRGALYKTIHDARRKLRAALADRELGAGGQRSRNVMTDPDLDPPSWPGSSDPPVPS